ncbi:MAG: metallophosphoesterase [Paludibacterium sp.]|uniref:metallophosphoesterase n=1 Tax=Paludibacterium sp. TaxID=1917523 RepID=UPI0025FC8DCD|nr:metallophosphoesterase [Paludibacterium sp.]MBV8048843.1 metallophosphoesterase [Paludibacterium sp.]MBV8646500.1 metallophosphoesterase [Paludibacterium sp.]
MKLLIYSDLHNEFTPFTAIDDACAAADVIVLAGDVDLHCRGVRWAQALSAQADGKPVLMVAGNHEFYNGHFTRTLAEMRRTAQGSTVHVLENDVITLDGVRFLGCSLWTDFALYGDPVPAAQAAGRGMNDYRLIGQGDDEHSLRPEDTLSRHRLSRAWLAQQLKQPFDGPTVVITHHAPSGRSLPPSRQGEVVSPAYASNLENLVGAPVALWIHGHIHSSCDYILHGTRVICNPRGYMPIQPNPQFNPACLIEL